MPLKHFTETFLIVVLGAVIALTGLLIATLPALPDGALPWAVLFVLSIIYPVSLYSLFQKRRADNFFRNLHWFPAVMLLLWMLTQGIAVSSGGAEQLGLYSWGWTLGAVIVGFVLIVMFCLKVIRRRLPRIAFLAVILVPFTAAAIVSEQEGHWEEELANVMWSADFWKVDESGLLANLSSDDEDEQQAAEDEENERSWREKLEMQERREERIAGRLKDSKTVAVAPKKELKDPEAMMAEKREETAKMMAERKPETLTESGFGWAAIILTLVAGYCATLHNRMRKAESGVIV